MNISILKYRKTLHAPSDIWMTGYRNGEAVHFAKTNNRAVLLDLLGSLFADCDRVIAHRS